MRVEMDRNPERITFSFAESATSSDVHFVGRYASCFLVFPAEFNGDTITIKTDISGDTGFDITAATGTYYFTSDELAKIFPMGTMQLVTNNAVSVAAEVVGDFKS